MKTLAVLLLIVLWNGCKTNTDANGNPINDTTIDVVFGGNPQTNPPDPADGEVVKVSLDSVYDGTATNGAGWYSNVKPGNHTIGMLGTVVPSKYTVTIYADSGHTSTVGFNCADAHIKFSADPSWIATDGVTQLWVLYHTSSWKSGTTGSNVQQYIDSVMLQPIAGSQSDSLYVQAGSVLVLKDQTHKIVGTDTLKTIVYDEKTSYNITPF